MVQYSDRTTESPEHWPDKIPYTAEIEVYQREDGIVVRTPEHAVHGLIGRRYRLSFGAGTWAPVVFHKPWIALCYFLFDNGEDVSKTLRS